MRVLMTTDTVGGVWTYALELARALGRLDVETTLVTLGPGPSTDQWWDAGRVDSLDVLDAGFALEWTDDPWDEIDAAGEWLLDLEADLRPDVVHLNGYALGSVPFRAPKLVVGHSCVSSWYRAVHGEPAPERYAEYDRRVRRGLAGADCVVAPTATYLTTLHQLYGPLRRSIAIPNGIHPPPPRPPIEKAPLVLAAGRVWDRAKNVAVLQQVAPRIEWPIKVVGDTAPPGGAEVHIRGLDLLGRLPREQARGWMERASIFCHPARYEPFGLGPLEAAASGCALVLGDIPTLREVWRGAAVYVPPDDPGAIARAIDQLAADPALLRRQATRARCHAARFDAAAQGAAYRRIYERLTAIRAEVSA